MYLHRQKPSDIQAGTDTKATVLAQLGNPSTTDVFEKEIWYYISSTRKERAFFKPKITERRVVSVIFDETGAVSDVGEYGLKDGIVVAYIKRKTPTWGRELSTASANSWKYWPPSSKHPWGE